jgi:oligopeptide transport system substrate-binding protein
LRAPSACALALALALGSACFSSDEGEQFYGRVTVPRAQEFRWSDGGLPRVFDPARAAAPPDTDAVRALYEGLTDYDPQMLAPVSADAYRWESSRDSRVWTFYLRGDAHWSNGDPVTAEDYLRSWQRTLRLGDDAPHADLLSNLTEVAEGERDAREVHESSGKSDTERDDKEQTSDEKTSDAPAGEVTTAQTRSTERGQSSGTERETTRATVVERKLAVEAVDDHTLRVRLRRPDPNLPLLLAHTIFRPVHASMLAEEIKPGESAPSHAGATSQRERMITNGAFRLSETTDEGVVLEREPAYRDAASVALDKVRFVNERSPESALREYRDGVIDAVTNANVEPAGLKLLASYQDFQRTTFGALTYYDFNSARPPFDDVRIREAFALALDRRRLSEDTLDGSTVPAEKFLPTQTSTDDGKQRDPDKSDANTNDPDKSDANKSDANKDDADKSESSRRLGYDPRRARRLLAEAGYPGGYGFPRVRLLVNRNEQHRQVAEAVVEMWRSVLGVEAEIEAKSWDEYETKLRAGEYDVAKRSYIMQTPDEEQSVAAMFPPGRFAFDAGEAPSTTASPMPSSQQNGSRADAAVLHNKPTTVRAPELLNEAQALKEVPAIPIYFASSFALVKPYVRGFDGNLLGVYSLKHVHIDTGWRPPTGEPGKVAALGR